MFKDCGANFEENVFDKARDDMKKKFLDRDYPLRAYADIQQAYYLNTDNYKKWHGSNVFKQWENTYEGAYALYSKYG